MKTQFEESFPELRSQIFDLIEMLDVSEQENKLFQDWYGKLVWDKSHFSSCFMRNLVRREVRAIMLFKYVSEGRRLGIFKRGEGG